MQSKDRLLLCILDRNEAHVRPTNGFTDRLGIGCIVFVGLDVGFDKQWCHQPYRMAEFLQFSGPIVGAATSLHTNQAGGKLAK